MPGFFQGLQVELLVDEESNDSFSMSTGAHVFINNQTTGPLYFEGMQFRNNMQFILVQNVYFLCF
jgi:hypothetical protein